METKVCTKCKRELPIDQFNWRSKKDNTRRSECKFCHSAFMKEKYREKKDTIQELKSQSKCAKCGEDRGYLLDYHHIDPSQKFDNISRMASNSYKLSTVYEEIKKCVCLCSNCHREFHYFEKHKQITLNEYLSS